MQMHKMRLTYFIRGNRNLYFTSQLEKMNLYFLFLCLGAIKISNCNESARESRFIAAFVSFPNERCVSDNNNNNINNNDVGVCFSKKKCSRLGGINIGTCAHGYGTCCKFTAQCTTTDDTINVTRNQTTLLTPTNLPRTCTFSFPRQPGVCQIRLDFPQFNLNRPNMDGECQNDSMTVSNTVTVDSLQICGVGASAANHMYLDYGTSDGPIQVTLKTIGARNTINMYGYQILTTQIKCESAKRVPADCLQYYTDQTGVVSSFNYAEMQGQQMNREDYKVCIEKRNPGDRIQWSLCNGTNFAAGIPANIPQNLCLVGETCGITPIVTCNTDYIEIPGSDGVRYCVVPFPKTVTSSNFWLRVRFDDTEPQSISPPTMLTGIPCDTLSSQAFPNHKLVDDGAGGCILEPKYFAADINNPGFCLAYTVVPGSTPLGDVKRI